MAISQTNLPEGTDSIISGTAGSDVVGDGPGFTSDTGYALSGTATSSTGSANRDTSATAGKLEDAADKVGDAAGKASEATAGLRAQATDKAYGIAAQGKDRAVGLLDNVTQFVDDAAAQIDEKAGEQYGAYARQASQAVAGFADTLRDRDVDDLLDDARTFVRKSPAVAIGAAAAIGFLLARVLKVGLAEGTGTSSAQPVDSPYVAPTTPTPSTATPSTATTVPVDAAF